MKFASFNYPKKIWELPSGTLGQRFQKRHDRKITGVYYLSRPNPNPHCKFFYFNSDLAPGLRIAEVGKTWLVSQFMDDGYRGIIARLPKSRGFLAGWTMGDGMASMLYYDIFTDYESARMMANEHARYQANLQHEEEIK